MEEEIEGLYEEKKLDEQGAYIILSKCAEFVGEKYINTCDRE